MDVRTPVIVSGLVVAGMAAVSLWAWPDIPENARIAVHFDIAGRANGFSSRAMALVLLPAVAAVLAAVFAAVSRRQQEPASSGYVTGWTGTLMLLFVIHCFIVLKARGWPVDVPGGTSAAIALVFFVVGNVLGKTRPNGLVGVRTPWTRMSGYSWDKSNHAAGRMLVAAGLATLATLAAAGSSNAHRVMVAGALLTAVISVALSYYYWRTDPDRQSDGH